MAERVKETWLRVTRVVDGAEHELWRYPLSGLTATGTPGATGYNVTVETGQSNSTVPEVQLATVVAVEYFEGQDGWYWHVVYGNGELASVSESYTRKDSARKAAVRMARKLGVEAVEV